MKDLEQIQREQHEWTTRVFGPQSPTLPLLGVVEEVGELCHAVLKREQGIRLDEDHIAGERDALGDIVIYMLDYCNRRGYSLLELVNDAWEIVRKRDKSPDGDLLARQRDDGTWVYVDPTGEDRSEPDESLYGAPGWEHGGAGGLVDGTDGGRAGGPVSPGGTCRCRTGNDCPHHKDEDESDSAEFD